MNKLEESGNTLVNTALHYTHPNFSDMYPDWGVVCNIGETLIEMSNQPTLNENQQIVFEWLKWSVNDQGRSSMDAVYLLVLGESLVSVSLAYIALTPKQQFEVLAAFVSWGMSQEVAE